MGREVPPPSQGNAPTEPQPLSPAEAAALPLVWELYYPREEFTPSDGRVNVVRLFRSFFGNAGRAFTDKLNLRHAEVVSFDYEEAVALCPMNDFTSCLRDQPADVLACMGIALCLLRESLCPPSGHASSPSRRKITVRVHNVQPIVPMAQLKSNSIGRLISVQGNVVRVSAIRPLATRMDFLCPRCGAVIPRFFLDGKYDPPLRCENSPCRSKIFVPDRASATTVDYQKIKIQEFEKDQTDPGRIPRTVEVELTEDLVDSCVPGDVVMISGIVKSINAEVHAGRNNARAKANSLFLLYLDAIAVTSTRSQQSAESQDKLNTFQFLTKDLYAIQYIAQSQNLFELIVHSLCPKIFGNELVKAGLILSLFGGTKCQSEERGVLHTRSDPHILVVGDPGLGKSQMLQAVNMVAPRGVYVCGNTTSTTGLTVTLVKDGSGDFGLEAGALVLADQGVCCIDEFDKMGIDYQALLEAMEQQSISIAKAGIVCTLSARTSVIAAANPVGGHYNRGKTVSENLKMTASLLSRFDLIFILLDRADQRRDELLSDHIMGLHASNKRRRTEEEGRERGRPGGQMEMEQERRSYYNGPIGPEGEEGESQEDQRTLLQRLRDSVGEMRDPLPAPLLTKYIAYARRYVHPKLTSEASQVLQSLYLKMRSTAREGEVPITTRQLESLIRLAQARAKVELREVVTARDAKDVVELMEESLLDAYTDEGGEIDFGRSGGMSLAKQVKTFMAAATRAAERRDSCLFSFQELLEVANSKGLQIADFREFVDLLRNECYVLKKGANSYQVVTAAYSAGGRR